MYIYISYNVFDDIVMVDASKKFMSHSHAMKAPLLTKMLRSAAKSLEAGLTKHPWHFSLQLQIEQDFPPPSTNLRTNGVSNFAPLKSGKGDYSHQSRDLSWASSFSIERTLIQTCSYSSRPEVDSVTMMGNSSVNTTGNSLLASSL